MTKEEENCHGNPYNNLHIGHSTVFVLCFPDSGLQIDREEGTKQELFRCKICNGNGRLLWPEQDERLGRTVAAMEDHIQKERQGHHNIRTLTLDIMEELSAKNNKKDITKYMEGSHDQKNTRNMLENF